MEFNLICQNLDEDLGTTMHITDLWGKIQYKLEWSKKENVNI